jgi:enoyl-CoA hydratase
MMSPEASSDTIPVIREQSQGVLTITLNRPEKLNSVTPEMLKLLDTYLDEAEFDEDIHAIVITGAGRAFSAGADMSSPENRDLATLWARDARHTQRQMRMWTYPKPLIAVLNGYCLGRGCEIALSCDIVIAEEGAKIGEPEIRQGSVLSSIVPWLVGMQHAKRFLLTGDTYGAREAASIGLVTEVVPDGEGLARGQWLARRISHIPPRVAAAVKRVVNTAYEEAGMRNAIQANLLLAASLDGLSPEELGTAEMMEVRRAQGMKAFLTVRDAPFK